MKFTVGDRVVLKHTGEEGYIASMPGKGMLEIVVGNVSFPAFENEVDHPYLKWFLEKNKAARKPSSQPEQLPVEKPGNARAARVSHGAFLSLLPVFVPGVMEDEVASFKIHLLYELPQAAALSYLVANAGGETIFQYQGIVQPFSNLYLHNLSLEETGAQPRFRWQFAEATAGSRPGKALKSGELRIRSARLARMLQELLEQNSPSASFLLTGDLDENIQTPAINTALKLPVLKPETHARQGFPLPSPVSEIDLHIEELTRDAHLMSPAEMIALQLSTLEYFVYLAIAHGQERLVVIHGIGNGTLRNAVAEYLKTVKEADKWSHDWAPRFGNGATVISFRYL